MQPRARPVPLYVIRVSTRLPRVLFAVSVALVLVHVLIQTYHYRWHEVPTLLKDMFDVDEEENIPTWFSGAILLLSCGLLLAIADTRKQQGGRNLLHWYGLAIGFAFLSFDEIAGLHETLNSIIVMTWAIPGAIAVVIVGLAYVPFLIGLPARTRWRFVVAGVIYVTGAVGMELLTDRFYLVKYTPDTLAYNLQTAVEEGLEMLGVVLFIHALLDYMRAEEGVPVTIALEPGE